MSASVVNVKHPTWSYQVRIQEKMLGLTDWKNETWVQHSTRLVQTSWLWMSVLEGVSSHPKEKPPFSAKWRFFFYFKIKPPYSRSINSSVLLLINLRCGTYYNRCSEQKRALEKQGRGKPHWHERVGIWSGFMNGRRGWQAVLDRGMIETLSVSG